MLIQIKESLDAAEPYILYIIVFNYDIFAVLSGFREITILST